MDFAQSFVKLLNTLTDYVKEVCKDRNDSHGLNHMLHVTMNAHQILQNDDNDLFEESLGETYLYISIVAMLHDVPDHKYDLDGTLHTQVFEFVRDKIIFDTEKAQFIMDIIDHLSFSKENKAIQSGNPINYVEVLGDFGAYIRDIVSDADKLEALGEIGLYRCIEFTKHTYKEKYGKEISNKLLKQKVIEHANEKLLRLKDEFFRTNYGTFLAIPLHDELIKAINEMP